MLKLKGIKKVYKTSDNEVHALKGVDLNFRKNEFVSVLGPSGCGKTTLLNIIGGLDHYTDGDLVIKGVSTKNYTDKEWDVYRNHRIGFVFQSYNLIPHQSVLGNVELALTIAGVSKKERRQRAIDALKRVGLEKELKKRPNQLSGGQMQRVAIARALVNNPEILLADEPTGALDTTTSVQIMDLIREISGDRLVIMVTHNPELAEQYSSRIIRLQDGLVVADSNPYKGESKREKLIAELKKRGVSPQKINAWKKEKDKKGGKEKASMSYGTALGLSGRNLRAKFARTAMTSFAGSIGIIGVSLVLALSSGFNAYIAKTEKDMLSAYPIQINEMAFDYASIMETMQKGSAKVDVTKLSDKIYVNSFLTKLGSNMLSTNTITQEYIDYLDDLDSDSYYALQYGYGGEITNNIYSEMSFPVDTGSQAGTSQTMDMSLNAMLGLYQGKLMTDEGASDYASLGEMFSTIQSAVYEMPTARDYLLSQYDVYDLDGKDGEYPSDDSTTDLVLVINNDGSMTDIMLMQLGLISIDEFIELSDPAASDETVYIDYERLLGKTYTYYPNDEIFYQKPDYATGNLEWWYKGFSTGSMPTLPTLDETKGTQLKISCILRAKPDTTYGSLSSGLAYMKGLSDKYSTDSRASNIVTTATSGKVNVSSYDLYKLMTGDYGGARMIDPLTVRKLGGESLPNSVKIYAKDFDSKDVITNHLDAWNDNHADDEAAQIKYTDTVAILMTLIRAMLDAVTYVLVAFTAISLIVSSVMIGVITYVSVVERTKEIGVLRALGARKKDIRRLFNAETFLIGLFAGGIGVGFTYVVSVPINLILGALTGISTLAALPLWQGGVMILISIGLNLISGLIPASSAAKKDPVMALRSE
ncbi:MAG: ABC transporter ATP-binding protein/permease [Clostridia bacterium]|nr:ABC transporter ATP-binding protein/permease [Clostridia bacterium]